MPQHDSRGHEKAKLAGRTQR